MAESQLKWNGTRIFILVMVAVFFLSTIAFAGIVVYEQFFKDETPAAVQDENQDAPQSSSEGTLEGTQLAGFTPVTGRVTELQIIDMVEGTGAVVEADDTITAHYTGALAATGIIFQSSLDSGSPFTSPLSGLIEGWQEGIPGMKVGGTRRLIIPAEMAYGNAAQGNIPADSDLVFDIQLIAIE